MADIDHSFEYRYTGNNPISALGDFATGFEVPCSVTGEIVSVFMDFSSVSGFDTGWYIGLKVDGAAILTGAERIHPTAAGEYSTTGLTEAVTRGAILKPYVETKGTGSIDGNVAIIITVRPTAKVTLADADTIGLTDSADSDKQKRVTVANLRTAMGTGTSWKQSVRVATTVAGTLATSFENGDTVDGVVLATGDRILIKDQGTASENGIYTVNASGAPTRATDADSSSEILQAAMFVQEGTANADKLFFLSTNAPITLGTTGLTFTEFTSGSGDVATDAIFDAKGDLAVGTGADTADNLTVGANDTILMAASGETTGLKWGTPTVVRTALGLATGDSPQLAGINLGHASDTTIARVGAGQISVEGVNVVTISSSDTLTNKTLTSPTINTPFIALTAGHSLDDTYTGITIPGLSNLGGVTQWDVVYLNSSSQWVLADANGTGTYPARGMAVATVATGNATTVLTYGTVRNDAWTWTVGGPIYLSGTAGGLTQTAPSTSGDKVQVVGYALTADIAFLDFNSTYVTVT